MSVQTVSINRPALMKAYNAATDEGKTLLMNLFEGHFTGKITDRVNTFDDILAIAGVTLPDLIGHCKTLDEEGYVMAKLIAEVYNEGTVLDPMNTEQYKYFPWFEITPGSGVGLACFGCDRWLSRSGVGVRLCLKSRELAIDAGKKFPDVYAKLLIAKTIVDGKEI